MTDENTSGSSQFYADNERQSEVTERDIDLSIAYEIKSKEVAEEEWEDQKVGFFCHDCHKLVEGQKAKKGLKFHCKACSGKKISFGTMRSLKNFFHLNDEGVAKK